MPIRIVLVASLCALLVWFLRSRNAASVRAAKKVLLVALVAFAVATVLEPGLADGMARLLGVGRGTDLLLYAVTVSFLYVTMNGYLKFHELQRQIAGLVRKIALLEANDCRRPSDETS